MTPVAVLLAAAVLTNAADIVSALSRNEQGRAFVIEGSVTLPSLAEKSEFLLIDTAGRGVPLRDYTKNSIGTFNAGDIIRTEGVLTNNIYGLPFACCRTLRVLSRGQVPAPLDATAKDLHSATLYGRRIRIRGTVKEAFRDEIDTKWIYVILNCAGEPVYATILEQGATMEALRLLTGTEVTAVGVCNTITDGLRRMAGPLVTVATTNDFRLADAYPSAPFSSPMLNSDLRCAPSEIVTLGKRRLIGRIIAVWNGNDFLLADPDGNVHKVRIADPPFPCYGDTIETEGFPETDLFRINLTSAVWRPSDAAIAIADTPCDQTAERLFLDEHGNRQIDPRVHGRLIRLVGTVVDLPGSGQDTMILKCGNFTVSIDVCANRSALGNLSVGCTVAAVGTCIVETESWRPYAAFPHATGITLVIRTPNDLTVLSHPSWWTARRLSVVIGILLLTLVAIFIWNRILQRVIDRKSRQLLKEQVAQIKATLRVDERTRLAVELHDSLSQNLSGVACQIAATKGTLTDGTGETARYLSVAERMLLSCRTELRRCLWDLRGDALEDTSFSDALRKTLAPVAIGVDTVIRFNVPRSRLSDTTAHAVLCIIRELVANAIRHGRAKSVRIAGEFHDGRLSFSVRDDGQGFDPSHCDGPTEGHFGLEGIRERIKHLNGTFALTSELGKGTRAEVTLTSILPKEKEPKA